MTLTTGFKFRLARTGFLQNNVDKKNIRLCAIIIRDTISSLFMFLSTQIMQSLYPSHPSLLILGNLTLHNSEQQRYSILNY